MTPNTLKPFVVLDHNGNVVLDEITDYFVLLDKIAQLCEGSYGPSNRHPKQIIWGGEVVVPDRAWEIAREYVAGRKVLLINADMELRRLHTPEWLVKKEGSK